MRLLYLRLPDYPPLKEIEVLFQQETILQRKGAVNFVVGVNGTGKSSLLRAIYETFRFLDRADVPPFPVTIGYDFETVSAWVRVLFHHPGGPASNAVFERHNTVRFPSSTPRPTYTLEDWQHLVTDLPGTATHSGIKPAPERVRGHLLSGNALVTASLPKQIVAYTSGDTRAWERPGLPPFRLEDISGTGSAMSVEDWPDERPFGWNRRDEEIYQAGQSEKRQSSPSPQRTSLPSERNQRCLLLNREDIRLAAIAFGLWAASQELPDYLEEGAIKNWRNELQKQIDDHEPAAGFRRLLQEVDWWFPTHVSFRIDPTRIGQLQRERRLSQLFALYAGSEEVMLHPLGRQQAVWCLTGRGDARGDDAGKSYFEEDQVPEFLSKCLRRIDTDRLNATAAVRLFSVQMAFSDLFQELRNWNQDGLLERLELTIKRVKANRLGQGDHADEDDDVILTYDSLSDGEQMLLGRMALLFLLQHQEDSLLLLDEPETHFNDVWKREIIDIVDDNLLKTTSAHVVVATHSSIALTDVFGPEITRFTKLPNEIIAETVAFPTFGSDPSRIMIHVFGAHDTIGARAAEFLREILAREWNEANREELEQLTNEIGSGWPRARLVQVLSELNAAPNP